MNWTVFIIPTIVGCMALVLLKLVDDKRHKSGRSRINAMTYAITFGATFSFAFGISFLHKNSSGVETSPQLPPPEIDIERMMGMADHSAKAPF